MPQIRVGFVYDYIPDPRLISKKELLTRDSSADRWLGALGKLGVEGIKYVPCREVTRVEEARHRFGHLVKLLPVTSKVLPLHIVSSRRASHTGLTSPLYGLEFLVSTLNLTREIKKDKISILHYMNYYSVNYVLSVLPSLRVPIVTWFTGGDVPKSRWSKWEWFLALTIAFNRTNIVMIGQYPSRIATLKWLLRSKQEKIRDFELLLVDRELFKPGDRELAKKELGYSKETFNILCIQSIIPPRLNEVEVRNPFLLVAVFAEMSKELRDARRPILTFIGTGPGVEELRELAKSLDVQDYVVFRGRIEHDKLRPYYVASDLVFVPYRLEALNETHVLAEAFTCGRPAIGFKRDPSVNQNQSGGFLITPDAVVGGSELAEIIRDQKRLEGKAQEALDASSRYDLQLSSSKLVDIYLGVLREQNPQRPG